MKNRTSPVIPFVLVAIAIVYLLVELPYGGALYALSHKPAFYEGGEQKQMSLELTILEGQTFKQGETINLVGKIKNVNRAVLTVRKPVDQRTLGVYIEFKPKLGFQEMQPNGFVFMVVPDPIKLRPLEEYLFTAVFTPTLYSLPQAGQYKVYMAYGNAPEDDRSVWVGDIKSPITTISIVE